MVSRERFFRDRKRRYMARIIGEPTDQQLALVQSMTRLEWAACVAESAGGLAGLRDSREHRRLFMRLMGDFERGLVEAATPRPMTPAEAMAAIHAGHAA